MIGTRFFQSICSETVRLKSDGQCLKNMEALHLAETMHDKAIVAVCIVREYPGTNGLLRLLPEGRKAQ
jgi:hypothetical protein